VLPQKQVKIEPENGILLKLKAFGLRSKSTLKAEVIHMSKIICIASCKGGIGKSTSVVNIGTALALQGKQVLVADIDSQHNLTTYLGVSSNAEFSLPALMKLVTEDAEDGALNAAVRQSIIQTKHLSVLPSHISLAGLEMGIAMATSREYILSRILACVKDEFDFILLDCLPSLGIFAINALTASAGVIIPVETHFGALEGFDQILGTVRMVQRRLNPRLEIDGVIMTKHQERTNFCRSVREMIEQECGERLKLLEPPVPYSIKVAETSALGVSIFEHDPKNPAAAAYAAIAEEVLRHAG
jgi:chromosome partitioning protein